MFDVDAEAYDRFMGRFSVPLASTFAEWSGVEAPARVLDVGCGTGALTGALVGLVGSGAVAAVDPSQPFVEAAQERFPGVDVRRASAEALPFGSGTFDAALAELVVHLMPDATAGVYEMARVVVPGGTLSVCVWDFSGGRAPQTRFFAALRSVAPDAEDESERLGARHGDLERLLRNEGLHDVIETELTVDVPFTGFDDWWEPYTHGIGPAGSQLASLPRAERERVRRAAEALVDDSPFTITATAWAARGRVADR
ncbi:class I SAM-dependent methyltransferase [Herbiconiux sp. UC225_62]|uniref:class I SAM-dependent methyltransferase n=1 Tax=Herbiconiux sp. UC225_62 TaxID=3350168 RepID=UPI0036D37467